MFLLNLGSLNAKLGNGCDRMVWRLYFSSVGGVCDEWGPEPVLWTDGIFPEIARNGVRKCIRLRGMF